MRISRLELKDLRNVREAVIELGPGLNVLYGRNAQGKTTVLEGVALLARGRSFRTEDVRSLVRRGTPCLLARGLALADGQADGRSTQLEVEVGESGRRLRVDGREVPPRAYHGRLEAVVYATDRLRVVYGPMRERRQFLDRAAAALWPAYRQALREYERVVAQRNAALHDAHGPRALEAWDERLVELGAALRQRRRGYVARLRAALQHGFHPEAYDVALTPGPVEGEGLERERLWSELQERRVAERRARRTLAGPHRDTVTLSIDGREAAAVASSGQARSLLLALALASLEVYRAERGASAVALLDDLDSELDEERTLALCREVAGRGQALVTTAHPDWAQRLAGEGTLFRVEDGDVRAA
ncbi:MAG TPA: DNA replication and repair protein RecF [Vicinamibacteria bacterium]